MNKLELIETLKTEAGLTKNESAAVVNLFFDEMSNTMAKGDRVEIRGLYSFYVKKYKTYFGTMSKTQAFGTWNLLHEEGVHSGEWTAEKMGNSR